MEKEIEIPWFVRGNDVLANRIDAAVEGLSDDQVLTTVQVDEIMGFRDNGAKTVRWLRQFAQQKRESFNKAVYGK